QAVAADGWDFTGWTGDFSGTEASVVLVMDADKSVTGVFEQITEPEPVDEVFVFDPNAYETGYNPVGDIFIQRRPGSSDFSAGTGIVETSTPLGSKVMYFANDQVNNWNDGGDRWLFWNEVPAEMEEVEFLYLFRRSDVVETELLGCMRMSGDGELNTYAAGLRNNPDEIRGRRLLNNDDLIEAGAVYHNLSGDTVGDWIWVRGRMDQDSYTIRSRAWLYGDNEPENWMLEWTDQDEAMKAGGFGLEVYIRQAGENVELAWLSVGMQGYTAPGPDDVPELPEPIEYHTLDISVEGQGAVSISPELDRYESGESVELQAVAADGWDFTGWTGDFSGTEASVVLVMDADKSVTGVFEQ
ncbi:hypothetical protein, partial [Desulfonatronospira sp. MSAO_Bac3]|uniref:InlB B-repeat-containing protein n=1 Tax=Desulfonatronospira sp. MSAO_Bac3 TaxID=2293857 RepID=UPI000FF35C81